MTDEPIKIIDIIVDGITNPSLDGTPGSALYAVPFRLSRTPSQLWSQAFVNSWNHPPSFSTMHRPGIASVYGDTIVLNGTTIEEVKEYHQKTLKLCVDEANNKEKEWLAQVQRREEERGREVEEHRKNVEDEARDISFDI